MIGSVNLVNASVNSGVKGFVFTEAEHRRSLPQCRRHLHDRVLQTAPMPIFNDGSQTRAFSYIDDVAPRIAEAIEHPAAWIQVFNVGADQPVPLKELASAVARAMQVPPQVTHLPPRSEVIHAHASHAKVRALFGPRPEISLDEGLSRMAASVRRHGARATRRFEAVELRRNLPPVWLGA